MAEETGVCTHCHGTGWIFKVKEGREMAFPCSCREGESRRAKLANANIPPRFFGCELKGFFPKKEYPSQERAKKTTERFIADYPATAGGLIFIGPTGVGKTRMLCSIGNQLIREKQADVYYIDWNDLVREMRSGEDMASRDFQSIGALIQKLAKVELLLFDELGASLPSQWVEDNIYYLINRRYNENRITIFASNYIITTNTEVEKYAHQFPNASQEKHSKEKESKKKVSKKDALQGEILIGRIGERIVSRICEMSLLVEIDGIDHRRNM